MKRDLFAVLAVSVLLSSSGPAAGKDKQPMADEFTGVYVNMDSPAAMGNPVSVWVEQYTSDDVIVKLKAALADKGQDGLYNAITGYRIGTIRIGTSNGYPIAVARQKVNADGSRTVILASTRPFSGFQPAAGTQVQDYRFGIIELKLDAQGKGEGVIIGAAQLAYDAEKNNLSIASYGTQPSRMSDVKTKAKKP